ncbi:MAG: hypothetical protein JKX94_02370, partial [Sneathiella sp.]|nr:hypothetical protein [Sneathiella sp.]
MTKTETAQEIENWLAQEMLGEMDSNGFLALFTEMCSRIDKSLFPLFRCHITMQTLHTFFNHNDYSWYRSGQLNVNALPRSQESRDSWKQSPLFPMLENLLSELRLDLKDQEIVGKYPLFQDLEPFKVTDYFALLFPFGEYRKSVEQKDGLMMSWIT